MTTLSESGFVAAAVASWFGIDNRLPTSASLRHLSYTHMGLTDGLRGEQVARVTQYGKRIAVLYNPCAGQRYGSWGRSGDCAATMVARSFHALNPAPAKHALIAVPSGVASLSGSIPDIVAALARNNRYGEAVALAKIAGIPRRTIPLPNSDTSNRPAPWRAETLRKQAETAAEYLVPELAKARRKREREAADAAKRERERMNRERIRLQPYTDAVYLARGALDRLTRGHWDHGTLLSRPEIAARITPEMRARIDAADAVFKVTDPGRMPCSGGDRTPWPEAGTWTPQVSPSVCVRGWHLCTAEGIGDWIQTREQELWFAEGQGRYSLQPRKVAYESARLVTLLAVGNLTQMGKPEPDQAAIEAARAALTKAEADYAMAREGY